MKGFIRLASAVAVAASGFGAIGCTGDAGERYRNHADPSWPDRYSSVARAETLAPFQAQASNGAVLDQTVWNYHFEVGSDKLTAAGLEKLDYLVRRRPAPDSKVYVQASRDIGYDGAAPERFADSRRDIDQRRASSVLKYLNAQTAGRPMAFEAQIIDAADPGFGAQYPANSIRGLVSQYQSGITGAAGGGGGGGGGQQSGGGQSSGGGGGGGR